MTSVYIVVIKGVYYQGHVGIYTTHAAALQRAEELADHSDGYHDFHIVEATLDAPAEPEVNLAWRHVSKPTNVVTRYLDGTTTKETIHPATTSK